MLFAYSRKATRRVSLSLCPQLGANGVQYFLVLRTQDNAHNEVSRQQMTSLLHNSPYVLRDIILYHLRYAA